MNTQDDLLRDITQQLAEVNARLDQLLAGSTVKKPADPKLWRGAVRAVFERRPDEWLAVRDVLGIIEGTKKPHLLPARDVCSRYLADLVNSEDHFLIREGENKRATRYRLNPDRLTEK